MAIGYEEWLKRTGKPRTKASADQWKTTHGVALGKYNPDGTPITQGGPTVVPQAPTPDPYLTPEGFGAASDPNTQSQIADLLAQYQQATGGTVDASGNFVPGATSGDIGSQYTQVVNQLAAQRPRIEQARRDRLNDITSEMAGRGLLRSGIREVDNTRANADAATALGDVERGIQQAGTDKGVALSNATASLLRGRQVAENQANYGYLNSRIQDFQNAYGGATPAPQPTSVVPAVTRKPVKVKKPVATRLNSGIAKGAKGFAR